MLAGDTISGHGPARYKKKEEKKGWKIENDKKRGGIVINHGCMCVYAHDCLGQSARNLVMLSLGCLVSTAPYCTSMYTTTVMERYMHVYLHLPCRMQCRYQQA